jgi:hypothetical protein
MVDWGPLKPVIALIVFIVALYIIAGIAPQFLASIWKGEIPILGISSYGFTLVIISGAIAFGGYAFYKFGWKTSAKICLTLAPVILFFGSLLIELTVFKAYLSKATSISVTQCTETFKLNQWQDIPMFMTCVFTGYFPAAGVEFASLSFVTFVIFVWLLPFTFLYFFFYGLFESTMTPLFSGGSTGKTVSTVISFIVATYGARQVIGTFLIDFLAYGAWGLVGIFIPLLLAVGLKRLLDSFIPIEMVEQTVWSAIGTNVYAQLNKAREEVTRLQNALLEAKRMGDQRAIDAMSRTAEGFVRELDAAAQGARASNNQQVAGAFEALKDSVKRQFNL